MPPDLQEDWMLLWAGRIALCVTAATTLYLDRLAPGGAAAWDLFCRVLPISCAASYILAYAQIARQRARQSTPNAPKWQTDIASPTAPTRFTRTPRT